MARALGFDTKDLGKPRSSCTYPDHLLQAQAFRTMFLHLSGLPSANSQRLPPHRCAVGSIISTGPWYTTDDVGSNPTTSPDSAREVLESQTTAKTLAKLERRNNSHLLVEKGVCLVAVMGVYPTMTLSVHLSPPVLLHNCLPGIQPRAYGLFLQLINDAAGNSTNPTASPLNRSSDPRSPTKEGRCNVLVARFCQYLRLSSHV